MEFLITAFQWNFKRFFAHPLPDCLQADPDQGSYCANTISSAISRSGTKSLLPVNLVLFAVGLIFSVADDYIQLSALSALIRGLALLLAFFFFLLQFDAYRISKNTNVLKLLYILSSCFSRSGICMTYLFLILFENITAFQMTGGC